MPHTLLLITSNMAFHRALSSIAEPFELTIILTENASTANTLSNMAAYRGIILDVPEAGCEESFRFLRELKVKYPELPVVVQVPSQNSHLVIEAIRAGAQNFCYHGDSGKRLAVILEESFCTEKLTSELNRLKRRLEGQTGFSEIIGTDKAILAACALAKRAAQSDIPVMIEGESGVGKELFARAIHFSSKRADKPFIAVNCGAIPENLAEATLFGHEKGAFTGAITKSLGKFREAEGGTLFLDEVGDLPSNLQVKLLRALHEQEVEPVGAGKPVRTNIRIISATHKNLQENTSSTPFREDLFYRLHVFPIDIPPLCKRPADLPLLIEYFCDYFACQEGKRIYGVTEEAKSLLLHHQWPGNIRELKNILYRAVVLCDDHYIGIEDLPYLTETLQGYSSVVENVETIFCSLRMLTPEGDFRELASLEKQIIETALRHYRGNVALVARKLSISRSTLYRKLQDYGISA